MPKGEHLHNNSDNNVKEARIVLELAKAQETDKLNSGYYYKRIDYKTRILTNGRTERK